MSSFVISISAFLVWHFRVFPQYSQAIFAIGCVFGVIWLITRLWKLLLIIGIFEMFNK